MTQVTSTANITWFSDQNRAILVPFDSSQWDESNGIKNVRFWPLDHAILQIKLKDKKLINYYTWTNYDAHMISRVLAIRIERFWYHSIRLKETSWMVPESFNSDYNITSYKQLKVKF